MSTTGKRIGRLAAPRLLPMLLAPRGAGREAYVAGSARLWQLIGSPAYPRDARAGQRRAPTRPTTAASPPAA